MEDSLFDLYSRAIIEDEFNNSNLHNTIFNLDKKIVSFKKKDLFTSDSRYIYRVLNGKVVLKRNDIIISIIGEGDFIGISSLFNSSNDIDSYEALEDITLLVFDKNELLLVLFGLQEGWVYLLLQEKLLNEEITNNHMLLCQTGKVRLKNTLYNLADEYGTPVSEGKLIPKCFNRTMLSSYTNLSLTTIKRLTESYMREGWLEIEKHCFKVKERSER
ncbi:Crp/Fnr family transcriptional regulator [Listeria booriae]|uniref:Crp/Fnr family transcriptional regulator n=1 Tax=Listeria booriae TaxID=1552123 RepID=UPI0016244B5D|nr:Crp/Fnr family transcriptional regulator [Listeria booriae]MBC2160146.1 Crp/Fnr family transcriptional regulator [Listeria booriae]MBC2162124.1 Crp/Fnr family transcriptional regulator [Listeria booriae]MBC2170623.1 Crp/Fnr family transcriptional regulator [Listeria booriae]MBC2174285.1 Crp/Fnr family transcriptional regulator [Listeria booriae]MBC2195359.1 Crp/Fnr family transcriptional regulator [Listeria booriae]